MEIRGISKTFGSIRVLSDVSLSAGAGEVHSLMGENDAGKSTLMKILSGAYRADPGGEVLIDGKPMPMGDPIAAKAAGIAVIRSFLSTHDLSSKTLAPFVTHGGYGLGNSLAVVAEHASGARLLDAFAKECDQERQTLREVTQWLQTVGTAR